MADVIHITNSKGGTGATTLAVLLGAALAREGERTLVVDGDYRCAAGLETCGLQGLSVYTLADAESGACRVKQAILQHPGQSNLYVLPTLDCSNPLFTESAVAECAPLFDTILCDCTALGACNRAVIVADPYPSSLTAARKKAATLHDGGIKQVGLVVNKLNGGLVFQGAVPTPQEIADFTRTTLVGVVPEDLYLPVGKVRPSALKALAMTARNLSGKADEVYGAIKPYAGVRGLIKRKLREFL